MSKINSETRITDNKGTAAFHTYCSHHKPSISWRAVSNDDIGIDGEVELYNENGEPLAEIIKIQLKSTEKDKGYIKNENPNNKTFTFYAEKDHVEYWQNLPNDVLLVVFDNRNDANRLYAKKIENIDIKNTGTKSIPIQFNQESDLLDVSKNDFLGKFSRTLNKENPKIKSIPTGEEKLISNLLKISFPTNRIYIAPINYDREEIIKSSWQTDRYLKKTATAREVALNALSQQGLKFSSDWTVFNKQVITFHDLNDKNLPLSRIVDTSVIESFSPEEFYSISDDHKSVFKAFLRFCLQQILYKLKFEWDREDKIFKYRVPFTIDKSFEHKEKWKGDKEAKRTVFKSQYWEKGKVYYCTHFAFSVDIVDFDNQYFLCLNPTWLVTINGNRKSKIGYKKVSQLKKLERNKSVYNHLRFISYKLTYVDLFTKNYPFIQFEDLLKLEIDKVIDEDTWLKVASDEEKNILKDREEPNDIKDEY
ncbi:protein of unknown function [Flexibacter flexilis DSM 6793]|uniref:DUF4365 domain-containing protein n=1 Tax=Flexibacter flexilis DSM 6793 TaxID=927664 RepID=A0A1I1NUK2_9BACT|nr:DUF4365 domain-containing protein [Flexibacter flexilis]SFD01289.1 protein of unknown function [Flexibacter flexilis DSM 6793]